MSYRLYPILFLDENARVAVRKNSVGGTSMRRRLNLIEGTNITLTVADDVAGEEVDVTIAAAPGGSATATTVEVDLGSTATFTGKFTITDASITAASKVLVWQAPGPYTGKGTRADEAEMQPIQIVSVTPGAGQASVRWQTPPVLVPRPVVPASGRVQTSTAAAVQATRYELVRLGLARGNVKFHYTVLT